MTGVVGHENSNRDDQVIIGVDTHQDQHVAVAIDQRVRERNRLDKGVSPSVGKSIRRHVRWLDREIERLDEEYKELLKHNASLSETAELHQTVPGVGQLTAATLVAYLPELGRWDRRALTSLAGLLPGQKRGSRSIRGGCGLVRRALYICAWAFSG